MIFLFYLLSFAKYLPRKVFKETPPRYNEGSPLIPDLAQLVVAADCSGYYWPTWLSAGRWFKSSNPEFFGFKTFGFRNTIPNVFISVNVKLQNTPIPFYKYKFMLIP